MDEKKVKEAIYCMKSFADDTVCEECANYDRCDHTMVANNARTAIEALEKQLPKNDLISRKELISRLNNSANRYHGGKCNDVEYKDVETFDVDEVYEIIDRVWEGVPEDNGEID